MMRVQLTTDLGLDAVGSSLVRVRVFGCGGSEGEVLDGWVAGVGGVGDGDDVPVGAEVFAEDGVIGLADFATL